MCRHELGGQLISYAGFRGILGGVRAPAPLEAPVQRQARLASKLDLARNQALTASLPQVRKGSLMRVHG